MEGRRLETCSFISKLAQNLSKGFRADYSGKDCFACQEVICTGKRKRSSMIAKFYKKALLREICQRAEDK